MTFKAVRDVRTQRMKDNQYKAGKVLLALPSCKREETSAEFCLFKKLSSAEQIQGGVFPGTQATTHKGKNTK